MRIWLLLVLLALAALIVAVIVGAIIWAVAATRKRRAERGDELTALGFEPVASPPPALRDALASLQAHAEGPPPTIGNLHRRSTPAGELYLLDTQGGDAGHIWLGAGTLAALISDLGAPSLVLLPGAPQPSGGLAQAALQRALDLIGSINGLVRIAYPDDVEFSERFVALGDDEEAVRAFLTDARRTALLELPPRRGLHRQGRAHRALALPTQHGTGRSPGTRPHPCGRTPADGPLPARRAHAYRS